MMIVNGYTIKPGANLDSADLRGADLHGANLHGANLRGADLDSANLHGADLDSANLKRANLHGANLRDANLRRADLHGANLRGANLRGANLRGADLRGANLGSANLGSANLDNASLRGASLSGASLRGAYLNGVDLSGARGLLDAADWLSRFERDADGVIAYKRIGKTDFPMPGTWTIKPGAVLVEVPNPERCTECGCGVNFGTREWCERYCVDADLWRCRIAWIDLAGVVVPYNTDGKARCARLTLIEIVT
jgi:hypothetical protein